MPLLQFTHSSQQFELIAGCATSSTGRVEPVRVRVFRNEPALALALFSDLFKLPATAALAIPESNSETGSNYILGGAAALLCRFTDLMTILRESGSASETLEENRSVAHNSVALAHRTRSR
jgi:hypothetical protein